MWELERNLFCFFVLELKYVREIYMKINIVVTVDTLLSLKVITTRSFNDVHSLMIRSGREVEH